jgi:malate dehydrogenase (oxaloacetate-decarboxylating)
MAALWLDERGAWRTTLRGRAVLADPRINKGTAFTLEEREALDLVGMLPDRVLTLEEQACRAYARHRAEPTALAKQVALNELRDRNQVLFYRLLAEHLPELLPIIYTPTVGEAIATYSHQYRRPRGVYLSADRPDAIERSLASAGLGPGDVDLIVATDAEAILGIGDWGVGGMDIAFGKLAVYTAASGVDPNRAIAVMLDVGTNNESLLADPLYLGLRHPRVSPDEYDRCVDIYVEAVSRMFPRALLHWEDFGTGNARRILERYRHRLLTFNDDVQGTGAVNLAAILAAVRATEIPIQEHRVVIFGSGTAGIGVADQLREAMIEDGLADAQAASRIWCVDRHGLLADGTPGMSEFQRRHARPARDVQGWHRDQGLGGIDLAEVVRRVHPTILVGTSAQNGAFGEEIVREMAAHTRRPVILPMSNPPSAAEAVPADLIRWTEGRALVATGSPFDPVTYDGVTYEIGQANNALVFPGLGLGVIAARATRVTDGMLFAAAGCIAELADPSTPGAALLPKVDTLRPTSAAVAAAVARAARRDGVAGAAVDGDIEDRVRRLMWTPVYRPVLPG